DIRWRDGGCRLPIIRSCRLVKTLPTAFRIGAAALEQIDRAMAVEDVLRLEHALFLGPDTDQRAATPQALGIDMRFLFRHVGMVQRPDQAACGTAEDGTCRRTREHRDQPAGG